jgi:hypothetical protein
VTCWIGERPTLDPAALERALEDIPVPGLEELAPDLAKPPLDLE